MQLFHVISILVPLALIVGLPRYLHRHATAYSPKYSWILYVACFLFFISWYLPSPLIHGEDTSFVTHVIGGGVFSGLLWIYLRYSLSWRWHWQVELITALGLVSGLGAMNELFELLLVVAGYASILITDTSWDIFANTLGTLVVCIGYKLYDSRH